MDANTESGRIHPLRVHIQSVSVHEMLYHHTVFAAYVHVC